MDSVRHDLEDTQRKVELYLSVNRFDAAEKLLLASIADYGSLANLHNLLGLTYHKQSRFFEAIKEFSKALRANPRFVEATLNLAATYCDLSQYEEAKEVFARAAEQVSARKKVPDLVLGRLANHHAEAGRLYEESGMVSDAIQEYRKGLQLFSKMPDVQFSLGRLYYRAGQYERAQKEFEELISGGFAGPEVHTWLGILHFKQGQKEKARRQWEKAQSVYPNDSASKAYLRVASEWPVDRGLNL